MVQLISSGSPSPPKSSLAAGPVRVASRRGAVVAPARVDEVRLRAQNALALGAPQLVTRLPRVEDHEAAHQLRARRRVQLAHDAVCAAESDGRRRTVLHYAAQCDDGDGRVNEADRNRLPGTDIVARAHALGLVVHPYTFRSEQKRLAGDCNIVLSQRIDSLGLRSFCL